MSIAHDVHPTPEIKCDLCEAWINKWTIAKADLMLCETCASDLERDRELREAMAARNVSLSWPAIGAALVACLWTAYIVDSWPLVDGIAYLGAAAASGAAAFKLYGRVRG